MKVPVAVAVACVLFASDVVVCVSRLPLPLPDCVPVVTAAAVVFRLHLEGRSSC